METKVLQKITFYQEFDGTVHQVEVPISCKVDLQDVRKKLDLPEYIDLSYPAMERAVISIWAGLNAPTLFPDLTQKKRIDKPISALLIGGGAVKMLSPSANASSAPFLRDIHDLDFIVPKNQGSKFVLLLSHLAEVAGTKYHYFLTESDNMFNALRGRRRYRIRALDWVGNNEPKVTETDIFVEKLQMRHTIHVSQVFDSAHENLYTIGLEKLIISKAQLITDLEKKDSHLLEQAGQTFRILPYDYRKDRLIVGMEEKDILDVCSLLLDHCADPHGVSTDKMLDMTRKDEKLLLTIRLNLQNILDRADWLRSKGLTERQITEVHEGVTTILHALPLVKKRWNKPWWNTEIVTPVVS